MSVSNACWVFHDSISMWQPTSGRFLPEPLTRAWEGVHTLGMIDLGQAVLAFDACCVPLMHSITGQPHSGRCIPSKAWEGGSARERDCL